MTTRLPASVRNNNPGNIRVSGKRFAGKVNHTGDQNTSFEAFATPEHGIAAMADLLKSYIQRGFNTPSKIISRWAPPSENNTSAYISFVCRQAGLSPNQTISGQDANAITGLMCAMIAKEGGATASGYYSPQVVQSGVQLSMQSGNQGPLAWLGEKAQQAGQWLGQQAASIYNGGKQVVQRVINGLGFVSLSSNITVPSNFIGPLQAGVKRTGELNNFVREKYDPIRYLWGGKNAERQPGLDCSGFVSSVFRDLFQTTIASPAREQAASIHSLFKGRTKLQQDLIPGQISAANIPAFAVISIKRGKEGGHVMLVTRDDNGNTVVWDSRGGRRNTAGNLGKGVTPGTLDETLRRLNRERGARIDIVDTTSLFSDLKSGHSVALTQQMLAAAWQADLETKQQTMVRTLAATNLNYQNIALNFTQALGDQALINRSTFVTNSATGQMVLNVAAGMSENWTKFSVISHIARAQGIDPRTAMQQAAAADPNGFGAWLQKPELQKMGYGPGSLRAAVTQPNLGQAVSYSPQGTTGGRVNNEIELLRQQQRLIGERLDQLAAAPVQAPAPAGAAQIPGAGQAYLG